MTQSPTEWEPKELVERWLTAHPRGPERDDFLHWFAATLEDAESHPFRRVPHQTQDVRLTFRDSGLRVLWLVWPEGRISLVEIQCPCHGTNVALTPSAQS